MKIILLICLFLLTSPLKAENETVYSWFQLGSHFTYYPTERLQVSLEGFLVAEDITEDEISFILYFSEQCALIRRNGDAIRIPAQTISKIADPERLIDIRYGAHYISHHWVNFQGVVAKRDPKDDKFFFAECVELHALRTKVPTHGLNLRAKDIPQASETTEKKDE